MMSAFFINQKNALFQSIFFDDFNTEPMSFRRKLLGNKAKYRNQSYISISKYSFQINRYDDSLDTALSFRRNLLGYKEVN